MVRRVSRLFCWAKAFFCWFVKGCLSWVEIFFGYWLVTGKSEAS